MSSQTKTQIQAAVIAVGIAIVANLLFSDYRYTYLDLVRSLQLTATGAVIFGILKAHPAHKAKFLLLWLIVSAIFLTTLLFVIQDYLVNRFRFDYIDRYLILICGVLSAAGIACMMNIMYKAYVELTVEPVQAVETAATAVTVVETKPPTYESTIKPVTIPVDC